MLLLMIGAALAAQAPLPLQWAHFERSGALSHIDETVAIASDGSESGALQYKLRYVRRDLHSDRIEWANSRTCPAIRPLLESMSRLTMPTPIAYGTASDRGEIVVDGTGYVLDTPSSFPSGHLTISSNEGSPLATWIDGAFTSLDRCWSTVELRIAPPR